MPRFLGHSENHPHCCRHPCHLHMSKGALRRHNIVSAQRTCLTVVFSPEFLVFQNVMAQISALLGGKHPRNADRNNEALLGLFASSVQ